LPASDAVGRDVVAAYRRNYGLGAEIGAEHVERHLALEGELTRGLLASAPADRWRTFSDAYTRLYQELPWLNTPESPRSAAWLAAWANLAPAGASVFEIGSGKAELLRFLLARGHPCVATEITAERGSKHLASADGLEWHSTDGVNLTAFEAPGSYDMVVSTQVIEHFHPADVATHFANAHALLRAGGRYVFDTPHRASGPHDLSRVFGMDSAAFMHLREYDWAEMRDFCRAADFADVRAVLRIGRWALPSRAYLAWLILIDAAERRFALSPRLRRQWRRLGRYLLVPTNIWIVARK
jgi:SAM-dependent methyltransferase